MADKSFVGKLDITERVLADGRIVVPGEPFDLSADDQKDEHNKRLIEEGQLVEAPKQSQGGK